MSHFKSLLIVFNVVKHIVKIVFENGMNNKDRVHHVDTMVIFSPVLTRIVHNQLNRLLVQCSLCLQTNIKRLEYLDHLLTLCPKSMINCPDKCGWRGQKENLEKHLYRCRNRACCCS